MKTAIMAHNGKPWLGRGRTDNGVHGWRGFGTREWWREPRAFFRPPGEKWFCIIRDPIERFVSAYRNRVAHLHDIGSEDLPDLNTFALTIQEHRKDRNIWHHVRPLKDFLGNDPSRFHRIFLLSEIEQIPDYVGLSMRIPREQVEGPQMRRSDLSDEAAQALEQFYAEDYRIWGKHLLGPDGMKFTERTVRNPT
jgi:hypothetical protein